MYVIRVYKRSHIPLFFMLPDASTSASLLNNKDMQLKQLGTISSAACRLWLVCLLGMGLAEAAYTDQQNRAMCALWCATDIGMSLDWSCSSCTSPSKPVCDWSRLVTLLAYLLE